MQLEFSGQIFVNASDTKFREDSSSGSPTVPRRRTDRHEEANKSVSAILRTLLKWRPVLPLCKSDTAVDGSRTRWRVGLHLWACPVITTKSAAVKVSLQTKSVSPYAQKSVSCNTARAEKTHNVYTGNGFASIWQWGIAYQNTEVI